MANSQSTISLQNILDIVNAMGNIVPQTNTGGSANQPFLTCCNDVMDAICAVNFPHKWNEFPIPGFYTSSQQQDYAVVDSLGNSLTGLSWLERGVAIDINNSAEPKPYFMVEVGRQLPTQTGTWAANMFRNPIFACNWFPNYMLYYGTWGAQNTGSGTFGNNPGPGSVYIDPQGGRVTAASWAATGGGQITFTLTYIPEGMDEANDILTVSNAFPSGYNGNFTIVSVSGQNVVVSAPVNPGAFQGGGLVGIQGSMPSNPITQITDANGNLLLLTTYGVEGTAAPVLPANSTAGATVQGTGATTTWTVVDPNGWGFRLTPCPNTSGPVYQIRLTAQKKAKRFTSTGQTLDPLPDEFETHFRDGVIAQLHKYSPLKEERVKFTELWALWKESLALLRSRESRELEENQFTLDRGIFGRRSNPRSNSWPGPAYPYFPG